MRFGGAMISLILPKLIRSLARDGIVFSSLAGTCRPLVLFVTTQSKRPAFAGNLPNSKPKFRCYSIRKFLLSAARLPPASAGNPPVSAFASAGELPALTLIRTGR
jgi:hypothetical protein